MANNFDAIEPAIWIISKSNCLIQVCQSQILIAQPLALVFYSRAEIMWLFSWTRQIMRAKCQ